MLNKLFDRSRPPPSLSAGLTVYAIGDIHGRADLLDELLRAVSTDAATARKSRNLLVFLGDYVDRGPGSKAVIDRLLGLPPEGFDLICMLGNHEDMFLDFLEDPSGGEAWLANGGDATALSYGVDVSAYFSAQSGDNDLKGLQQALAAAIPAEHKTFLRTLRSYHVEGDYFFSHAGLRPGIPVDRQDPHDLIWIRGTFLRSRKDHGKVVVHGHSVTFEPTEYPEASRLSRIGIDTGAYVTGRLTCLVLCGDQRKLIMTGSQSSQAAPAH